MTRRELEQLHKRVQRKDRDAEDRLIDLHAELYPRSPLNKQRRGDAPEYRHDLHTMYLHVHRKLTK